MTSRVNELVQEHEGIQLYLRDMILERNAATKVFNSEQELREALTEELKTTRSIRPRKTTRSNTLRMQACHDPQDGNTHDKRPRTQATSTRHIAPATTARPRALPPKQPTSPLSPDCQHWAPQQSELDRATPHHQDQDKTLQVSAVSSSTNQASPHWEINYRKIIGIYRSLSDKFR